MLPDQARMRGSGDPDKDQWLLQERFDRLPIFYDAHMLGTTISSTVTNSSFETEGSLSPTGFYWIKDEPWTDACLEMEGSWYSDAVDTGIEVGLRIDGTDYGVARSFVNPASTHRSFHGWRYLSDFGNPPLRPGRYLCEFVWRRYTGAGTASMDVNDWVHARVTETVPPRV